jgi:hypothetical protein
VRIAFKKIEIDRWRGFRGAVLGDFEPGLNVVYAGNSIGKSTFALALAAVLGKKLPSGQEKDLEFRVSVWKGTELAEEVFTPKSTGMIPAELGASLYLLELSDLMSGTLDADSQEWLKGRVGGLPVSAAPRSSSIKQSRSALSTSVQGLATLKAQLEDLAKEEAELLILKSRLELARRAEMDRSLLEDWALRLAQQKELLDCLALIQSAERDEPRLLHHLEGAKETLAEALAEARRREQLLSRAQEGTNSWVGTYQPLSVWESSRLKELAERERDLNREILAAQAALAEAQAREEALRADLSALGSEGLESLEDLPKWEQWQQDLLAHEARKAEKDGLTRATERIEVDSKEGPQALRVLDWIKSEPQTGQDLRPMILGVLAVAGTCVGFLELQTPIRVGVVVVAAGTAVLVAWLLAPQVDDSARKALEAELGAMSPERAAEMLQSESEKDGKRRAKQYLESKSDLTLEEPAVPDWMKDSAHAAVAAGRLLAQLTAAKAEARGKEAALADLEEERERLSSESEAIALKSGVAWQDQSLQSFAANLAEWDSRLRDLRTAEREKADADARVGRELERCGLSRETPWSEAEELAHHVWESRESWLQLKERAREMEHKIGERKTSRDQVDQLLGGLFPQSDNRDEVVQKMEDLRVVGSQTIDLESEVKRIEAKIAVASQGRDVSDAALAVSRALDAHRFSVEAQTQARITEMLSTRWRALARQELSPVLVNSARSRLLQISRQRYRLDVVESGDPALGGVVTVVDNARGGTPYELNKLSSGARVHVSLAVRLAVIEDMERTSGKRAPLILDEVQAVSDPEARQLIAEALKLIAEERQVIVFTNQPEEVVLFGVKPIRITNDTTALVPIPHEPAPPDSDPRDTLLLDRRISLSAQPQIAALAKEAGLEQAVEDLLEQLRTEVPPLSPRTFAAKPDKPKVGESKAIEIAESVGGRHAAFRQYKSEFTPAAWAKLAEVLADLPTLEELRSRLTELAPPGTRSLDLDWAARLIHDSL